MKETEGLLKVIKKLEQTIPITIENYLLSDTEKNFTIEEGLKVEFEKHLIIYPELQGKLF